MLWKMVPKPLLKCIHHIQSPSLIHWVSYFAIEDWASPAPSALMQSNQSLILGVTKKCEVTVMIFQKAAVVEGFFVNILMEIEKS